MYFIVKHMFVAHLQNCSCKTNETQMVLRLGYIVYDNSGNGIKTVYETAYETGRHEIKNIASIHKTFKGAYYIKDP